MLKKTTEPLSVEEQIIMSNALHSGLVELEYQDGIDLYKDGLISEEAKMLILEPKAPSKAALAKAAEMKTALELAEKTGDLRLKEIKDMESKLEIKKNALLLDYKAIIKSNAKVAAAKTANKVATEAVEYFI